MSCSLREGVASELVVGYTARTLDGKTSANFEQHLEGCEGCRELLAGQQAVWFALDEWRAPEVSPDFDQKLFQRIGEQKQASWWHSLFRPGRSWVRAVPVAAACALLVAAFFLKDPGDDAAPPTQSQARPQIEQQVERALDDMDMLSQIGVDDAVGAPSSSKKI